MEYFFSLQSFNFAYFSFLLQQSAWFLITVSNGVIKKEFNGEYITFIGSFNYAVRVLQVFWRAEVGHYFGAVLKAHFY